jgi:DNA-binding SARP family transcriptional activator
VEFRILGPLEVWHEGRRLSAGGAKQRAVLAMLLLHVGEVVSRDRLVAAVWREAPPATATAALQNLVSQLRRTLGLQDVLLTRPPGYVLELEPEQLDLDRFRRLVRQARDAPAGAAAGALREALALWRGPALADFEEQPFARVEVMRLQEERVAAHEALADRELELGHHAQLVGELETLAAMHPLRERLREQLMLALYRSGRQVEALEVYADARRELVEALGIEPAEGLRRLHRAVLEQDPALRAPAAAAPAAARRKTVTVLACRVLPAAELDPEVRERRLTPALDAAAAAVTRHGGTAERGPGDALTGVFGVPELHEDDVLRALRAATELVGTAASLDVDVAVGVDSGDVVAVGDVVRGDVFAAAARLREAAGPGEVLFGERTRSLADQSVLAERVELTMRGRARPLELWRLDRLESDARLPPRSLDASLVGREYELGQLHRTWERVKREQVTVLMTLLGVAGIGKTRLAREFAASRDDAAVAFGQCLPYGDGMTFHPLEEIVRTLAGGDLAPFVARTLVGDRDAAVVAAHVHSAIGGGEPAGTADELFWSIRRLLETAARVRPLVLVFEDLHWGEPTLLDLVEHVAEAARGAPLLLLCLARPELLDRRPGWGERSPNAVSLPLETLSAEYAEALVDELSGSAPIPPEARARVLAIAEGNPLFLEQLVAAAVDASASGDVPVPPTIQALLASRLERLPASERAVLAAAAVIGGEFGLGALAALLTGRERGVLRQSLQLLVRKELVRPHGRVLGDETFRFRHALIRDGAYESVAKTVRQALHGAFAAWLDANARDGSGDVDEVAGFHFEHAFRLAEELDNVDEAARAQGERAAVLLAAAGRRALGRGDGPAAASLLDRSVALFDSKDSRRLELLPDLATALGLSSDAERAESVLAQAIREAVAAGNRRVEATAALELEARRFYRLGSRASLDALLRVAERSRATFEELGDGLGMCRAWRKVSLVHLIRCRYASCWEAAERAYAHARSSGSAIDELPIMNTLGVACVEGPTPVPEALARVEELLPRARRYPACEANLLTCAAALYAMDGELAEARSLVSRAERILVDLGTNSQLALVEFNAGRAELLAGDSHLALTRLRRSYELAAGGSGRGYLSTVAAYLSRASYELGLYDEAEALAAVAEEAGSADDVATQITLKATQAKLAARRGSPRRADTLARQAVEVAAATDALNEHATALVDLAHVSALTSWRDPASCLRQAAVLYERKANRVSASRVADALGERSAAAGD